jgi:serine/threonine protein phosphatase 1
VPAEDEKARPDEMMELTTGMFFPDDVISWLDGLPYYYEDEHAIYVHAGLPPKEGGFSHPTEVDDPMVLLWIRTESFFRDYRGKLVVFGHTRTEFLPQELSGYTPEDPTDLWAGENVVGIDTGCGSGGFLSAVELPAMRVYESR